LLAPVPADGELFGFSLDIEGDRILIGAPLASARAGMAHVFVRNAGIWSHDGQLSAIDGLPGDRLGWSVALAAGMAIAGAPYALDGCGAGYGFRRVAGVWSSTSETAVTMPLPGQLLGWSVAASTEGWTVGAPGYAGAPDHAGAAYWFQRADVIFASGFEVMPVAVVSGTGKCLPQ
jgi:hypothetical protein